MKTVYLVENNCCGSSLTELVNFLRKRLGEAASVEYINLAKAKESSLIPRVVRERIESAGLGVLPSMIVDNVIVAEGYAPNFFEAIEAVEHGTPLAHKTAGAAMLTKACCGS